MEKVKEKLDYFCGINAYLKNEDDSKLIIHKESDIKISDDPKYKNKFDISDYIC